MDKEAKDMDDISSTPLFSMNSVTTEDLADGDKLMHRDDVSEDQEVTKLRNHSVISDESGLTYLSSWCSYRDSDISDMITPFDQNIDEEIKQVCQNVFNLENLETEADDFGENEDVQTTDTGSTSSLAIRSNESMVPALCPSSSSSNTAITKADKMLMQSTEAVKIQTDNYLEHDSKEVMMEGGCKGKRKKSQLKKFFSGRWKNRVQPAPLEHLNDAGSQQGSLCSEEMPSASCSAALRADLRSAQLQRVNYTEDEDQTPEDTRNVLSSLSSATSIPPDYRVVEITWAKRPEDPPLTESTTDEFQEEVSSSLSQQSTDSSEEDEEPFSQSSVEQSQSDSECLSNNQSNAEETKAKKSNNFSRFICKILSKNSVSSDMDKEAEDMDDISSTPLFSMNSVTTEDLADVDELMHRDDVSEDQEVTKLRNHSVISDESGLTYLSSWCSYRDSDISDMITPFDQNIDEEIKQVCQNVFNLENLETEADDFGENEDVQTTDTGSTSSLAIRSNESMVPALCPSSSSSNTAITKADKMLMQSTEAVKIQTDNYLEHDSKKVMMEGGCKGKRKKSQLKKFFCGRRKNRVQPAPLEHLNDAGSQQGSLCSEEMPSASCSAALRADLRSAQLQRVDYTEDEDQTPEDTRNVLSSLSSATSIPPDYRVVEIPWAKRPEDPPLTESTTDEFQEEVSSSLSQQSTDSSEEDEEPFSQSSVEQSQSDSECLSNNQSDAEETKAKKSNNFSRFICKILSKNSVSSDMDKEAEDMDDISSTPLFSMNSVTTEDLADGDKLMHRDDVSEDQEVTRLRNHSVISDESGLTYLSSWCSYRDSHISDMITPFDQNIDEEIKPVCQNFFNLENLETGAEDCGAKVEIRTTDTGSTSSLVIRSNESMVPALCPSSSSSNTTITKADKMLISQVIDETVKTPQSTETVKTLQSTETVHTPQSTETIKKPQSTETVKTLQSTETVKTPQSTETVQMPQSTETVKTPQSTETVQTPQSTETVQTPQSTETVKTPQSTETVQTPQSTETVQTPQSTETVQTPQSTETVQTPQSTEAIKKLQSTEAVKTQQALQASLDRGSSRITAAARCLASKDRAAKKTLKRAIKTIKSFLPGGSTAVKRKWCFSGRRRNRICSQETSSTTSCIAALGADLRSTKLVLVDYVEDEDQTPDDTRNVLSSLSSASSIKPNYQVKVAWSKWPENPPLTESTTDESKEEVSSSLIQQFTDSDEENEETFSQSSVEQFQTDSECLSNNQSDAEETKAKKSNNFSRFFCKIFSKNKQEEKEKVSAENQTKQSSFWMWLLFCSDCGCCLD
ncbi:dentin sialophosphoprotein-like [Perca flavescens]|uniref:dentin sialophosphoprotein-like n=1 Tax=Perca flavescens TaxID=8167 RepID=UPI00106E1B82|nr:dentin sialophosphoprotein-like [Perca flavescens]